MKLLARHIGMVLTMAETDPMYKRLLGQADRNRASTSSISCESVTVGIVNQPHRVKLRLTGQAVHGATFAQQAAKPRTTDNVLIFIFVFRKKFNYFSCREHWEKPCRNTGLFCWATVAKNATVQKARCTLIQCTLNQCRGLPTSFPKGTPTFMGKQTFTDFHNQSTNLFTDFSQTKHESAYGISAPKAQVRLRQGTGPFTPLGRKSIARGRLHQSAKTNARGRLRLFSGFCVGLK